MVALVRATGVVVQPRDMMTRLVAVGVLADQARDVGLGAAGGGLVGREQRVEAGDERVFPAHAVDNRTLEREFKPGNRPMSFPKKQWQRVRKAAGCNDLRIHDLRRSASHTVIKATGNPRAAQKVLGHADLSTTLRHYASVTDEETREAVEALASEVLNGAS